jgi:hypothetical protein
MAQFVALAASIAALVLPGQDKKKDSPSTRNISPSAAVFGPPCAGFLFVGLGEMHLLFSITWNPYSCIGCLIPTLHLFNFSTSLWCKRRANFLSLLPIVKDTRANKIQLPWKMSIA